MKEVNADIMNFGLFHLMQKRDPALTPAEVYQHLRDRVRLAEDIGMTHSWVARRSTLLPLGRRDGQFKTRKER